MINPDHSWPVLIISDQFWSILTSPNHSWPVLITPEKSWYFLTSPGHSWPVLIIPDQAWSFLTSSDHSWPVLIILDQSWSLLTSPDHSWPVFIIPDQFWSLQDLKCKETWFGKPELRSWPSPTLTVLAVWYWGQGLEQLSTTHDHPSAWGTSLCFEVPHLNYCTQYLIFIFHIEYPYSTIPDQSWSFLTSPDHSWPVLIILTSPDHFDQSWSFLTSPDHSWPFLTLFD